MILVFGGTTEGRKAVEVLEEAGTTYYYSTRSDGQKIDLVHGIHLTGGMDIPEMIACCREHHIRLIVDAAHPFAEELHRNLLFLAKHLQVPIIRYDRIYPPHTDDVVWCKDYQDAMTKLEADHIDRLLALTGVNNISTLRPYWEKHECWFRILNRRFSQMLAHKSQFPEDHLVYYEEDETQTLIEQLKPQAILTKESGISGGFAEKVEIAKQAGVRIYVIERPAYPPHTPNPQPVHIEYVNGPYGLRRKVEQMLPEFYPLHSGLTTGTCATAAAIAATLQLQENLTSHLTHHPSLITHHSSLPSSVPVILPNGETIPVPVGYGDGYAYVIKESGDDPDVTNGIEIRASVSRYENRPTSKTDLTPHSSLLTPRIKIIAGEGIGHFTLPGFDYPPGEPAINKGPREMIERNLKELILGEGLEVRLSVVNGEEIARRTFNPRLGIEGGISIIGVSGIVKPFSEEAFVNSIRKCMQVAKAAFGEGHDRVVINSGAKSERYLKALYPDLPQQAFVQYGNYIGETLKIAHELHIPNITLGVMLGKAVKLADGQLDTHSRKGTMNKDFIAQLLHEAGLSSLIAPPSTLLESLTLARDLWNQIPLSCHQAFADVVIRHCETHCRPLLPDGHLIILLITDEGEVYGNP